MRASLRLAMFGCLALVATVAARGLGLYGGTSASAAMAAQAEVTARIAASARAVVTALDEPGRLKVQFAFEGQQKTR